MESFRLKDTVCEIAGRSWANDNLNYNLFFLIDFQIFLELNEALNHFFYTGILNIVLAFRMWGLVY